MSIYVNDRKVNWTKFPAGEINLVLDKFIVDTSNDIRMVYRSSEDIIALLMVVDSIRRLKNNPKLFLDLPYLPYARQDRVNNPGEALSLKVFCNLINSIDFNSVTIYDPHSYVSSALLNNVVVEDLRSCFFHTFIGAGKFDIVNYKPQVSSDTVLIAPDAGAEKKVASLAKDVNRPYILATKTRDTKTGDITGTVLHGDVSGKDVIVVDDICDGGKTFIELGKILKNSGCNSTALYVTNGLFTKGLDELKLYYDNIYAYFNHLEMK